MAHQSIRRIFAATLMAAGMVVGGLGGFSAAPAAASSLNTIAPGDPYGEDSCAPGYVWRVARPTDLVCVTPAVRDQTVIENQIAADLRAPNGGAYGPLTCRAGYVWRDAFDGDSVCVLPASRAQAHYDNAHVYCHQRHEVPPPNC